MDGSPFSLVMDFSFALRASLVFMVPWLLIEKKDSIFLFGFEEKNAFSTSTVYLRYRL